MNHKGKGSAAERELIHMFWREDWAAFRAAGSGSTKYPCPDVIAGNAIRKLAIEVKSIAADAKYFPKVEIEALRLFSHRFGCEAWVGIRFSAGKWFFFSLEDLKETRLGYSIRVRDAELKGFTFSELIKTTY